MAKLPAIENEVRSHRVQRGWSQHDLALRAGLSRTGVGAIEAGRLVPSTAAALALAAALGCRVDDLFRLPSTALKAPEWAWHPRDLAGRYWHAEVGGRTLLYPVEGSPLGVIPHDGTFRPRVELGPGPEPVPGSGQADPARTLVLSCCDPAVGLLAAELAHAAGVRLIVLGRSSRDALGMLQAGVAHVAGVHLATAGDPGNERAVRAAAGTGFLLLRLAEWEEGIASAPARKVTTVGGAIRSRLRWVGRDVGSGARQCQDELLGDRPPPRRSASDHRGVAEAIRSGWADLGVCLRLAAAEAGLNFLSLRREAYDLCFPATLEHDPRIQALIAAVQAPTYRQAIAELPGYDRAATGELRRV